MKEYNGAMMQFFHWYLPTDGSLWNQLANDAKNLAEAGITSLWLPPAYKADGGVNDVGYATYDLFDLGEFDQKGAVRTKYGTKDEYINAIKQAQQAGIRVYADVVMNHKIGGDAEEEFEAVPYSLENREKQIGEKETVKTWTHFSFPGRGDQYSSLKWHWWHFNAVDHNSHALDKKAVYLIDGKTFHQQVDDEHGNYDYLMGCNLDIASEDVRKELLYWGEWYVNTTGIDGFRFDAVKHVGAEFFVEWLNHTRQKTGKDLFAVGEYWSGENDSLKNFLAQTNHQIMLFDASLHYKFAEAGRAKQQFDLTKIFDGTLVQSHPESAVTLVSNHDTQPLQSLESRVEAWFKPLAYALILLRREGYPCVFYADYYGADYQDTDNEGNTHNIHMPSHRTLIDCFLKARKNYAYGEQQDFFDDPNCIGWTRLGNHTHTGGLAVLISNADAKSKKMFTGQTDTTYTDITGHIKQSIKTDSEGWAEFKVNATSVSVWLPQK